MVLTAYQRWCQIVGLVPFAGGDYRNQGPAEQAGYITSGYRSLALEGNKDSPHGYAFAIDVAVGDGARQIAAAAPAVDLFTRIGLYPQRGFIHLDHAPDNWIEAHNKAKYWCQWNGIYRYFTRWTDLAEFVRSSCGI